ncbi:MAG: c-type cytochrome [Gemmatimonadota bacterium]|jgi:mono/diheme cytochrome c family protein
MRRRRLPRYRYSLVLVPLALASCGGDADAPAAEPAAETLEVGALSPATFDTIGWDTERAALDRGATVYSYSCAKCHGDSGRGDGGYVLEGRLLKPPSFRTADWRFANDLQGLRETILQGNDKGMPHWGEAGLTPRDTDAVARYITRRLWAQM